MKRLSNHLSFGFALACALVAFPAAAEFHTFVIEEIFSNADGTIQYVVLHESLGFNGENFLGGQTFTATSGMTTNTYVFNRDLPGGEMGGGYGMPMPSPTAHARVLIATQGFAALGLVTPDYVIPNGFIPLANGTINYAGVDQVSYTALPTDGTSAITRTGVAGFESGDQLHGPVGVRDRGSGPARDDFGGGVLLRRLEFLLRDLLPGRDRRAGWRSLRGGVEAHGPDFQRVALGQQRHGGADLPFLHHVLRPEELALLHAECGRMRRAQDHQPGLAVRVDRLLHRARRRQRQLSPGYDPAVSVLR